MSGITQDKSTPLEGIKEKWKMTVQRIRDKIQVQTAAKNMNMVIAKPVLRGHLNRQIVKNVLVAFTLSAIGGVLFQTLYAAPKKQKYADFYKTYDAEAEFRRMRDLGLFVSAQPGEE